MRPRFLKRRRIHVLPEPFPQRTMAHHIVVASVWLSHEIASGGRNVDALARWRRGTEDTAAPEDVLLAHRVLDAARATDEPRREIRRLLDEVLPQVRASLAEAQA